MPSAARWRVPSVLSMRGFAESGTNTPAWRIWKFLMIAAPSCSGFSSAGMKMAYRSSLVTDASSRVPAWRMNSLSDASRSKTMSAPILFAASIDAARITSSTTAVSCALANHANFPTRTSARRMSSWKIMRMKMTTTDMNWSSSM